MSFIVTKAGPLALLTDLGRMGYHRLGLTTGGPLDKRSFLWANQLLNNDSNATALEIVMGGLTLTCQQDTQICVTGANMPFQLNGVDAKSWRTLQIKAGDQLNFGHAIEGMRSYLAVKGGFAVAPEFGSTATVVREKIGGLNGDKLTQGDILPFEKVSPIAPQQLPKVHQPRFSKHITLRVVLGLQQNLFSQLEQRRFFSSTYKVSTKIDRMGYRLEGPAIHSDSNKMLSEGICLGAIQIPADGQPIVLMQDRQTIGGYPKIGAILSLDLDKLGQAAPGTTLSFEPITAYCAHNILQLDKVKMHNIAQNLADGSEVS